MKVLCLYPNCEGYGRVPLGFSLVISCLLQAGHEVELFDTTFITTDRHMDDDVRKKAKWVLPTDISQLYHPHTREEIGEMLQWHIRRCDLVAVTILENNYPYADYLLSIIKAVSKIPVIAGGSTPSSVPEVIIENPYIDYVCEGEGEETIVEFCNLMFQGKSVDNVHNIWSKKVHHPPLRPFVDMDSLPIQHLEIWDSKHLLKPYSGHLRKSGYFELSRGCPRQCSYCINKRLQGLQRECGPYLRRKSILKAIKEISTLHKQYCFEMIFFNDDNFLLMSQARFEEFIDVWMNEVKLDYWMNTELESITEYRLECLKESGCVGISIGLESGSESVRTNILHRQFMSNDEVVRRLKMIQASGIRFTVNSIIGSPGESEEQIFETINLLRRVKPKSISVSFMTPYAGTEIHETAVKAGLVNTYKAPGFRGLVRGVSVREGPVMRQPQISEARLKELFYKFSDYVYGGE